MSITIQKPSITAAAITPNPAYINNEITIEIYAAEITVVLEEQTIPAGTFYAGEEWK